MDFDRFGRSVGRKLLFKDPVIGRQLLLCPLVGPRYFEFEFVRSCIPNVPESCLDISSPYLFSTYLASQNPSAKISIQNPDVRDAEFTSRIAKLLDLKNLHSTSDNVENLSSSAARYQCAWSISVFEHIDGDCDDSKAIRLVYESLRPGGTLAVTVPVDRVFRNEYRQSDAYGTQPKVGDGTYFYQRFYDLEALKNRLWDPIGVMPEKVEWFGENEAGIFARHEEQRLNDRIRFTVSYPEIMARHYSRFDAWQAMPGMGICGFLIRKP